METMKKFLKYTIWIILFYVLTEGLIYIGTKDKYKNITNFNIETKSPIIEISKFESSYTNGYIEVKTTNNTGEYIKESYLKVDFYNKEGNSLGTKYQELNNFNATESMKVNVYYEYTGVESANFSIVKEKSEDNSMLDLSDDFKKYQKWGPVIGIFTLLYVI